MISAIVFGENVRGPLKRPRSPALQESLAPGSGKKWHADLTTMRNGMKTGLAVVLRWAAPHKL